MEMLKEMKIYWMLRMRIIRGITIINSGNNINTGNEASMTAPVNDYVEGAHVVNLLIKR